MEAGMYFIYLCLLPCCIIVTIATYYTARGVFYSNGNDIDLLVSKLDIQLLNDEMVRNVLENMKHSLREQLVEMRQTLQETEDAVKASEASRLSKLNEAMESFWNEALQTVIQDTTSTEADLQTKLAEEKSNLFGKFGNLKFEMQTIKAEAPVTTVMTAEHKGTYESCEDVPTTLSGIYVLQLEPGQNVAVYCEQSAFDGGWLVFQHRYDGKEQFYRNWTDYRNGFGNLNGEFWFGLEHLHKMTTARKHELMVEMKDYYGNYGYAHYDEFVIDSEAERYRLKVGNHDGTAGDSLKLHQGMKFSTPDVDNDALSHWACAPDFYGAWWYNNCHNSNLNGGYKNVTSSYSMTWHNFKDDWRSLSYSRMMVREVN